MTKIIYHAGTGTWFGADDGVYIIDLDDKTLESLIEGNDIVLDDWVDAEVEWSVTSLDSIRKIIVN